MLLNTNVFCQTHMLFHLSKSLKVCRLRINISFYINRFFSYFPALSFLTEDTLSNCHPIFKILRAISYMISNTPCTISKNSHRACCLLVVHELHRSNKLQCRLVSSVTNLKGNRKKKEIKFSPHLIQLLQSKTPVHFHEQ